MQPPPDMMPTCPPLIGREREVVILRRAVDTVAASNGRMLLLSGEAGLGKSRLVGETRDYAATQGFEVLQGRCFQPDRATPYSPISDLLLTHLRSGAARDLQESLGSMTRVLFPLLPGLALQCHELPLLAPLDAQSEKRRLFFALTHYILRRCEAQPVLLIVEDLHWSDDGSLEFLHHLARQSSDHRLLMLLTYRDDEPGPAVPRWIDGLERERVAHELVLSPLSKPEIGIMLRTLARLPVEDHTALLDHIYPLAEGNPFFVEEIVRALHASGDLSHQANTMRRSRGRRPRIPRSVQRIVEQRTGQVSAAAREVAVLAAVAGRRFEFAVLEQLAGHDEERLLASIKELIEAQLVVEESAEQFAFRHELVRQAIYAGLLARERRALHLRVAEVLAAGYTGNNGTIEARVGDLAYHSYEANAWADAMEYARRAAEQALYAPATAVEQLGRALDAAQRLAIHPEPQLYRARGQAYTTLGQFEAALADLESALEAARAYQDRREEWQSLLDLATLWAERDYARMGDYCRQALELARAMDQPPAVAESLNRRGNWQLNSGRPGDALHDHKEALAIFERLGDQRGIARTLDLLGMASSLGGDPLAALAYYDQAIDLLRAVDDKPTLASTLASMAWWSPAHREQGEEAVRIAQAIGWRSVEGYALIGMGYHMASIGQYGRALAEAQRGLDIAEEITHREWMAAGHCVLGWLYFDLLAAASARDHLETALALAREIGSGYWEQMALSSLVQAYLLQGDRARAEELFATIFDADRLDPLEPAQLWLGVPAAELAMARGRPERALHYLDQMRGPISRLAGSHVQPQFLELRARALAMLDRIAEAEADLLAAREAADGGGYRPRLWRVHAALWNLYRIQGREEEAGIAFTAARVIIEELAATIADEALRERFRGSAMALMPAGVSRPSPRRAETGPGGLTAREKEVAILIALGRTNRQIAQELVVSVKTVEAHISRILGRLDFSSRAQIAAWSVGEGLAPAPRDLSNR